MPRKRISSHVNKTSRTSEPLKDLKALNKYSSSAGQNGGVRFIGISLSGGKNDKACVAILEYFPVHKKIFLTKIFDKIKNEEAISADLKIVEICEQYKENTISVCMDAPLSLPLCLTCELKCPGYENCIEEHIVWMKSHTQNKNKQKKPKRNFTPYTQRSIEMYFAQELEEAFQVSHAMGANMAPLMARAIFLSKRISIPIIEVSPALTLWNVGNDLGIAKRHLKFHRHSATGLESRKIILKALNDHNLAFLYQQDLQVMSENSHAFEAFLNALMGFITFQGNNHKRPQSFPQKESWIEFPK